MMILLVFYYSDMVNRMDVVDYYYYFDFVDMDPLRLVHNTVMVVVAAAAVVVDMAVDPVAARAIVSQTIAVAAAAAVS